MRFCRLLIYGILFASVLTVRCYSDSRTLSETPLILSIEGKTDYVIVKPDSPSAVDNYAVIELCGNLQQITGAEFKVVVADKIKNDSKCIFVGISKPALKELGADPLSELKDQEHVVKTIGDNLFIYGKGVHGNMYGVFEFLESQLGWRWYSMYEHPVIPRKPNLTFAPVNLKKGFSFPYRRITSSANIDFPYIHGANSGVTGRKNKLLRRHPDKYTKEQFAPYIEKTKEIGRAHGLHIFIPPEANSKFDHITKKFTEKQYFKTNPEYFSLWTNGKRVPNKQLCLSNLELRKELTKNIIKYIELEKNNKELILNIGPMDRPGKLCYCDNCKKLEEKYKTPGGPMFDYLIELCNILKEKYPKLKVKSFAYRRGQTEISPTLPKNERLPDNLIIDFAPIDDAYFADWINHKDKRTRATFTNLQRWGDICSHLSVWQYPNPYGTGAFMPVGSIERLINNMRVIHKVGAEHIYLDNSGYRQRAHFSELQRYLFFKLAKDINADTDALIKEFIDNFYGPAAPLMRTYIKELEQCRINIKKFPNINWRSNNFDMATFPYLTEENIHRWQEYFDQMEKAVKNSTERIKMNVNIARRELDFAILWKWSDLKKKYPEYYKDYTIYEKRIKQVNNADPLPDMKDGIQNRTAWEKKNERVFSRKARPLSQSVASDFVALIKCGGQEKPLPVQFAGIDKSRIKTFVPKYSTRRKGKAIIKDSEAAFGYGVPVAVPDIPFTFGFYQKDTKKRYAKAVIKKEDITPGVYKTYKLGIIDITPSCLIWFSSNWSTNLLLGERLYKPGSNNHWEAFVTLKFDGPGYGSKTINKKLASLKERINFGDYRHGKKGEDLVLVSRIILVKQNK